MLNRYKLLFKLIKNKVYKWLDIGCGTGLIFEYQQKNYKNIYYKVGIELNKNLYNFARKKYQKNQVLLIKISCNLIQMKNFDLITMIEYCKIVVMNIKNF